MPPEFLFSGTIIHCTDPSTVEIIENGFLHVVENKIVYCGDKLPEIGSETVKVILKKTKFIIPGFIDTHIHAPQYPNIGLGYDGELLEWLQKYTYPIEDKFKNILYAEKIYRHVIKKTLTCGTTTACYFGTSHVSSNLKLAELAIEFGQRCFVGHLSYIDKNHPPEKKRTLSELISDATMFIQKTLLMKSELVKPIVTPGCANSCNMETLTKLADLAKQYNLKIQTHLSENKTANFMALAKNPDASSCADIFYKAGVLTNQTILAHCVHLTPDEMRLISKCGSSISHCPSSNTYLHSGLCDIKTLTENGIKCSLGTDISAGAYPNIMEAMRAALQTASHVEFHKVNKSKWWSFTDAFYLATLGGAKVIGLDDRIGNFGIGKELDALVINADFGFVDFTDGCSPTELLQKFIYLGDDRNVEQVYVASRCVKK